MKKVLIIILVVLSASCSRKILMPSTADASRGSAKYPGLTVDELKQGKKLYDHKCTQCHSAKDPRSMDEVAWNKTVPAMAARATKMNKEEISHADQEIILKYLVTMSSAKK